MRTLDSVALVTSSAVTSALLVTMSHSLISPPNAPLLLGLYEPVATSIQQAAFDVEAKFFDWNDKRLRGHIREFLDRSRRQGRLPLLTLEPFPHRVGEGGEDDHGLIADVMAGKYDGVIDDLSVILSEEPAPVLLRFAHEMDIVGQYAWSFENPEHYIRLYRYVHDRLNARPLPHVRWVWSPAGTQKADLYWPGAAYVDVIGVSVYASRAWTPDRRLRSFAEVLAERRWLQRRFRRPLLVAEAGVSGSEADQWQWLQAALATLEESPEVCGLVYFHAPQPLWMPLPTGHEDWQLAQRPLEWLLDQLPQSPRRRLRCVEG